MKPEPAIGMLVERGAVEEAEAVLVGREVRRDPVEQDADAFLVKMVDECHQLLGIAVARGRREVAGRLVTPRAVERMLGQRHQLDVREAEPLDVLGQLGRDLAVRQRAVAVLDDATPRAEVHLVDRDRRGRIARLRARRHPGGIPPLIRRLPHDRRGARSELVADRVRIGLRDHVAGLLRGEVILVEGALGDAGDEALPDACVADRLERMNPRLPGVPVADHADGRRVRRPHRESDRVADDVRTELLVKPRVLALAHEIRVELAEPGFRARHRRPSSSASKPRSGISSHSGRLLSS
jgi:hypothetical protein